MNTATAWHSGVVSDLGLRRSSNEDRVFADDGRGIFLVVDGMGGHAAGETAAETAVQTIKDRIGSLDANGNPEAAIRAAITEANNRIYELAGSRSEWRGMACVLTLAVVQEERVTLGHVGDSRLYLLWNGHLKKLTADHSPVGEQEDAGALTEEEAMRHPRRNEVFRDVGSRPHASDDPEFIETNSFLFRPDAALLLSSDGLSDVLTSSEIADVIEKYDGAAQKTAQQLIEAANQAGGTDNISVVFVPGPEFLGSQCRTLTEARPRHAITRMRGDESSWRAAGRNALWVVAGIVLGIVLASFLEGFVSLRGRTVSPSIGRNAPIVVNSTDPHGIQKALERALSGDTIEIPPGDYLGPVELKDHVALSSKIPGQTKLRSDSSASTYPGIAIVARSVRAARVEGLRVVADETHPLRAGVWIIDSSVEIANLDISGASESGIRIEGASEPTLLANFIHANSGAGVLIRKPGTPRLFGNWIIENGKVVKSPRAGIEVDDGARPQLDRNFVVRNGLGEGSTGDPSREAAK